MQLIWKFNHSFIRSTGRLMVAALLGLSLLWSTAAPAFAQETAAAGGTVEARVARMPLNKKIEQMSMPDFRKWKDASGSLQNVTVLNDDIRSALKTFDFGGVILFAENTKGTEQTTRLVDDIQKTSALKEDGIPLLISIDQEGGSVVRLGQGTTLPGNMALGATGDTSLAKVSGEILGKELSALGINTDFAPDLDINNNPANPIIGLRSFSDDPAVVSDMGTAMLQGIQSQNVISAVKHFPGHGDTAVDSHSGLPLVNKSYDEIKNFELIPFQAAINTGTDIVMTAHIQYPKIETGVYTEHGEDTYIPATLSKTFITDILRGDMGYDGVVSTDSLQMKAISDHFNAMDVAKMAINAGADILLMPVVMESSADINNMQSYINGIAQMVESGSIKEETIDAAVTRILKMKEKRGVLTPDSRSVEEKVAAAQMIVGSPENYKIERSITQKSTTVTLNKNNTLPLKPVAGEKILMLYPYEEEKEDLEWGLGRLMVEGVVDDEILPETYQYKKDTVSNNSASDSSVSISMPQIEEDTGLEGGSDLNKELLEKINATDIVLMDVEIYSEKNLDPNHWISGMPDKIIAAAKAAGKQVVLISAALPYDTVRYPDVDAMVAVYNPNGVNGDTYGPNIPGAFDIIFGAVEPSGKLPVNIPKLENYKFSKEIQYARGTGITDLKETKGQVEINMPQFAQMGQPFTLATNLKGMPQLTKEGFALSLNMDSHFEVNAVKVDGAESTYTLMNGVLKIDAKTPAGSLDNLPISITLTPKEAGTYSALNLSAFADGRGRSFTPQQTGSSSITINSTPSPTPTPTPTPEPTPAPGPGTGLQKSNTPLIIAVVLIVLAVAILVWVVVKRKNKK